MTIDAQSLLIRFLVTGFLVVCGQAALADQRTIPLFVSAFTSDAPQGRLRILNSSGESGTVAIHAIDDAGARFGPATFTLNAWATVEFEPFDFSSGNAAKGLSNGLGIGDGHFRLVLDADFPIRPSAYVRAPDGALAAMHDTVRRATVAGSGRFRYDVPVFNPASEVTQVSRLRLINPGDAAASITIGARDDSGAAATGGDVTLTLAAGGAQTLTAQQLEAGNTALTGRLGAGTGKWRLTVSSDRQLQVVNIVAATAGYWNNLSTTAVPGAAPADLEAFNERFVGNAVVYVAGSDRYTLNAQTGGRFTETAEIDGVSTTYMGSYGYSAIGADAGRLTLTYDDADVCAANLYFSTRTAGWIASHCTGSEYPAEGTWSGGSWSVDEDEGDGGEVTDTLYGVGDALPGAPTAGLFIPSDLSGGSVEATADGTTIDLNDGGYFELSDGTRYTCTSADGCTVANGTVTAGTMTGPAPDTGEVDRFPSFRSATNPGDRTYTVGTAIDALTLPAASGGNGALAYSLSPSVPGLTFDATTRQLTGSPSTAGTHGMTYTVTDEDGDTDRLSFTITVQEAVSGSPDLVAQSPSVSNRGPEPGASITISATVRNQGAGESAATTLRYYRSADATITTGDTEVGTGAVSALSASTGSDESISLTAPSAAGTYYYGACVDLVSGESDTGNNCSTAVRVTVGGGNVPGGFDWQLDDGNGVPAGIIYVNGRFYVADTSDQKVYAYTASGERDAAADFDLDPDNSHPDGLTFANGRFYVADRGDQKVYAYTVSGERDAAADFDLDPDNSHPDGLTFANDRFYVLDRFYDKVYAYSELGEHDAAADFDLHADNDSPRTITYANGRFYVVDGGDRKVYAYTESGERDAPADLEGIGGSWITYANGRFYMAHGGDPTVYGYTASGERDRAADLRLLPGDNKNPSDIVYANGRFYVVDFYASRRKAYAYTESGERDVAADFDLHADDNFGLTITYANGRFYVVDWDDEKVYAYAGSGERDAAADFDLDPDNTHPDGLTFANGRFYVVDWDDEKVYAYAGSGERDASADYLLNKGDKSIPWRITYANGRFYVVQTRYRVFAYTESGERDAAADFRLHEDNLGPWGISYTDGWFYVLDAGRNKVFAYPGPGSQVGGETSYGVGDTIATLPTGSWFPDVTSGGSFALSGGNAVVRLNNGGYIEEGDYRYTCESAGGCQITNGTVESGTIVETSTATMPEDTQPSFAGGSGPGNQTYTVGTAIDTLTLPAASGGDGTLTYSLSPSVPRLTFNATTRQLTGTPTAAGAHAMTYTAADEDGDTDTLGFTITVSAGTTQTGSLGECYVSLSVGIGQSCTYPGTTDAFSVNARGRGSFLTFLAGIRIRINNQTIDGRVFDFEASHQGDGVWRIDRIAGSTETPTTGGGGMEPQDSSPSFAADAGPGNQTYTVSTAIATLTLPEASGGNGTLAYSLSPNVPGLSFNATTRQFTGTPSTAGAYAMTYTVTDEDGDTDTLSFTIAVEESSGDGTGFDLNSDNDPFLPSFDPTGISYANNRVYVVDSGDDDDGVGVAVGRLRDKVYAYLSSGQRDAAADFDLDNDNRSPAGITYANNRFYVVDSIDDKVYAYLSSGQRDAAADFDLDDDNSNPTGITHANDRFFVVDFIDDKVYAYLGSGQRDATADFDLDDDNGNPTGITHANDRFFVVDWVFGDDDKVYAYLGSGQRDAAADFDLSDDNGIPRGITYANDRFFVVDTFDRVHVYGGTTEGGGGDSETRYEVGDAIATLPTGSWFPDLTRGSVAFRIVGGVPAIDFGNGGYIEEGSNRYTCASAGGCQLRGREVRAGTIVETPSGVAPEEIPPTSDTAGTCEVDLGRSTSAGGTETVSVALSDALETEVGTLDAPFIVRAGMDSASDFDVYRIVLDEAGLLAVLSSGALDTQAVLMRSDCTEAGRVVEDVGVLEGFAANNYNFTLGGDLDPGTYYMVVFEWASRTGNYALGLTFAADDGVNDTPVIEPVTRQEVAPGGTATVDVEITDDTGDAHAIVATSDNEDVATVVLRGSGSSRSLVITAETAGTATVTLRAVDREDAVASPVTFDVIVASPALAAPALEPGSNDGEIEVTVVTTFRPRETRAHDYQIRVKRPQTPWHTVGCHAITNNSDGTASGPFSVTLGNNPAGLTYEVRYRYRNSSSCNAGSPGPWSAVAEGISSGTAANATPEFPEGASTDRSVHENVGGGINVGSPVAALDSDGGRDVLTYSLGGADAGSFRIVPATGQIRTRDGIAYDHEARDTYSVTVEASDVHSETDLISVDIHILDLGSVCVSPPGLRLNSGDGELAVRWSPLADQAGSASVLGYEVERRDGTGGAWGSRQTIGGRATSNITYTGLVNGRQYDIRIRPFGNEDPCDWSAPVSGIPTTDTAPRDQSDFEDRVPPGTQLRDWRFPLPGRFSEMRDGRQLDGSYRYVRTDPERGTITFEYDEIGRAGCEVSLLFSSLTSGSFLDECEGAGVNVDVDFDIEEPPAPSEEVSPRSMEEFDALAFGNDNILPGFHFGDLIAGDGAAVSGIVRHARGESVYDGRQGNYFYENTGLASGLLTIRFGCLTLRLGGNPCPREEWNNIQNDNEEWVFELTFRSPDAAEYTVTIHRHGRAPLTLNGFIDFKAGDNPSSFPPELLPPGSPPQASGNDLLGVDAATGSTSISIGGDSLQIILVQDGGIQDFAYQPGDWLEPKDGSNQRMMIVGTGQTGAQVAAGLVSRSRTPAQASSAAQSIVSAVQTDLIALSVVCMQIEKGIPARGSRFFSQPKSPDGAVQMCQRNCVVAGGDTIQRCVWECEGSAESATSVVDDFGDGAMRQLLDALGGSSASEPIGTGVRSRRNDLKTMLPRID